MVWPRGVQAYAAGADGLQVTLADDSRVEMRAHAEMSVDRASDGIQIDLKTGDIIVTAARQRDGHLYVRTKDMTVAVDGTVFLVNAGQQGSRVGVIEGEVRVAAKAHCGDTAAARRTGGDESNARAATAGGGHRVEPQRHRAPRDSRLVHEGRGADHSPAHTAGAAGGRHRRADARCDGRRARVRGSLDQAVRSRQPAGGSARSGRWRPEQRLHDARPVVCAVHDARHADPDGLWISVGGPGSGDWLVHESRGAWTRGTASVPALYTQPPPKTAGAFAEGQTGCAPRAYTIEAVAEGLPADQNACAPIAGRTNRPPQPRARRLAGRPTLPRCPARCCGRSSNGGSA